MGNNGYYGLQTGAAMMRGIMDSYTKGVMMQSNIIQFEAQMKRQNEQDQFNRTMAVREMNAADDARTYDKAYKQIGLQIQLANQDYARKHQAYTDNLEVAKLDQQQKEKTFMYASGLKEKATAEIKGIQDEFATMMLKPDAVLNPDKIKYYQDRLANFKATHMDVLGIDNSPSAIPQMVMSTSPAMDEMSIEDGSVNTQPVVINGKEVRPAGTLKVPTLRIRNTPPAQVPQDQQLPVLQASTGGNGTMSMKVPQTPTDPAPVSKPATISRIGGGYNRFGPNMMADVDGSGIPAVQAAADVSTSQLPASTESNESVPYYVKAGLTKLPSGEYGKLRDDGSYDEYKMDKDGDLVPTNNVIEYERDMSGKNKNTPITVGELSKVSSGNLEDNKKFLEEKVFDYETLKDRDANRATAHIKDLYAANLNKYINQPESTVKTLREASATYAEAAREDVVTAINAMDVDETNKQKMRDIARSMGQLSDDDILKIELAGDVKADLQKALIPITERASSAGRGILASNISPVTIGAAIVDVGAQGVEGARRWMHGAPGQKTTETDMMLKGLKHWAKPRYPKAEVDRVRNETKLHLLNALSKDNLENVSGNVEKDKFGWGPLTKAYEKMDRLGMLNKVIGDIRVPSDDGTKMVKADLKTVAGRNICRAKLRVYMSKVYSDVIDDEISKNIGDDIYETAPENK